MHLWFICNQNVSILLGEYVKLHSENLVFIWFVVLHVQDCEGISVLVLTIDLIFFALWQKTKWYISIVSWNHFRAKQNNPKGYRMQKHLIGTRITKRLTIKTCFSFVYIWFAVVVRIDSISVMRFIYMFFMFVVRSMSRKLEFVNLEYASEGIRGSRSRICFII